MEVGLVANVWVPRQYLCNASRNKGLAPLDDPEPAFRRCRPRHRESNGCLREGFTAMDINEVSPDSATPYKAAEGSAMLAVDGLPASVRRYIDAVCRIYHCPREFVVAAVMATAATAVGKKIKVDRRSGYTMLIRDPFCNIIGDLQTGMLRPTFGSELFMTNGLNQRFLFTIAEDIDYPERSHATLPADTAREWEQTVRMLYEGIYHDSCGNHCTLFRSSDGDVSLSEGADRLYDAYYNELQAKKAAARTDYEASVYSKLQIQVLRYAGIVHALEVAEEKGARADYYLLHASTMAYAIRCMRYFERMALQVYGILSTPGDDGAPTTKTATLRSLLRFYPETNRSRLAEALGVSGALISKVGKEARLRG